jgi:hypothetical protein
LRILIRIQQANQLKSTGSGCSCLAEFRIWIQAGSETRKVKKVEDPQKREKTFHVMKNGTFSIEGWKSSKEA